MLNKDSYQNTYPPYSKELGELGQIVAARRLTDKGWTLKTPKIGSEISSLVDYVATRTSKLTGKTEKRLIEVKAYRAFDYAYSNFNTLKLPFKRCDAYDDCYKKEKLPLDLVWVDFRNRKILIQDFRTLTTPKKVRGKIFPFVMESENWEEPRQMIFAVEQFDELSSVTEDEFRQFDEIRIKYDLDRSDMVGGKVESGKVESDDDTFFDNYLPPNEQAELLKAVNVFKTEPLEKIADEDFSEKGQVESEKVEEDAPPTFFKGTKGYNARLKIAEESSDEEKPCEVENNSDLEEENQRLREEIERLKNPPQKKTPQLFFAERMFETMEKKNLAIKDVAAACGINNETLAHIREGARALKIPDAVAVADYLDVSLDWLCGRDSR